MCVDQKGMRIYNVVSMRWDAFGDMTKNTAFENNIHPRTWTNEKYSRMKAEIKNDGYVL